MQASDECLHSFIASFLQQGFGAFSVLGPVVGLEAIAVNEITSAPFSQKFIFSGESRQQANRYE